jgi:hypothetical protein
MLLLLPVQFDTMDECSVLMVVPTDLEAEALWSPWVSCVILVFLKRGGCRCGLIPRHFSSCSVSEGPKRRPEGGEYEPIKTFYLESLAYDPISTPQVLSFRVCEV